MGFLGIGLLLIMLLVEVFMNRLSMLRRSDSGCFGCVYVANLASYFLGSFLGMQK